MSTISLLKGRRIRWLASRTAPSVSGQSLITGRWRSTSASATSSCGGLVRTPVCVSTLLESNSCPRCESTERAAFFLWLAFSGGLRRTHNTGASRGEEGRGLVVCSSLQPQSLLVACGCLVSVLPVLRRAAQRGRLEGPVREGPQAGSEGRACHDDHARIHSCPQRGAKTLVHGV